MDDEIITTEPATDQDPTDQDPSDDPPPASPGGGEHAVDVTEAQIATLKAELAALEEKHREYVVRSASAVYKSRWMNMNAANDPALQQALNELAEYGCGAIHGFLVPDGQYFNENTAQVGGKVNIGDNVWMRGKGFAKASKEDTLPWQN